MKSTWVEYFQNVFFSALCNMLCVSIYFKTCRMDFKHGVFWRLRIIFFFKYFSCSTSHYNDLYFFQKKLSRFFSRVVVVVVGGIKKLDWQQFWAMIYISSYHTGVRHLAKLAPAKLLSDTWIHWWNWRTDEIFRKHNCMNTGH